MGNIYYVAPSSTSGSGTIDDPFGLPDLLNSNNSIGRALANLQPGDTLYFRGGDYHVNSGTGSGNQLIHPANSGTALQPITLRAYPGETPRFIDDNTGRGGPAIFGTDNNTVAASLNYVRFLGFTVLCATNTQDIIYSPAQAFDISGTGNEIGYCEVVGQYWGGANNHEGIILYLANDVWVHHNNIHGFTGVPGAQNSSGIKIYDSYVTLVEDNYVHDNNDGVMDKDGGAHGADVHQGTVRRNYLVNNSVMQFDGPVQGDKCVLSIYDNVIFGTAGLGMNNDNGQVYNNLLMSLTISGVGNYNAFSGAANAFGASIWNNVANVSNTPFQVLRNGYEVYAQSGPTAPIAYMDYNVYTATPGTEAYHFAGQDFTLSQFQAEGFEQHISIVAGLASVYQDLTSYVLLPQWQTAGRYGDAVGPRCGVALILNTSRYGPGALN